MGYLKVKNIEKEDNVLSVDYEISNDLSHYFDMENKFKVEYGENIERVPDEIAIIPFVSNVLPIIWLTDSTLVLEKLDKTYYESIKRTKEAFRATYPKARFKGNVEVKNVIKTEKQQNRKDNSSVFFSGGIDSVSSLVSIIDKKPLLITIWGTDVWIHNEEGWESLEELAKDYSRQLDLKNLFIKTNFRKFIYEHVLTKELLEGVIDDSWWRGIQHGIGLLGHVAPYAYLYNISTHYIPATLNVKSQKGTTCGSCPEIDETVTYMNCKIVHEGYDKTRIEKAAHIVNYFRNKGETIKLRVCFMDKGSKLNCCQCEKCYLSMMELLSEKVDLKDWGFDITGEVLRNIPNFLKEHASSSPINKEIWLDIKNKFNEDKEYWKKKKDVKWILKYNPYQKSLKQIFEERKSSKLSSLLLVNKENKLPENYKTNLVKYGEFWIDKVVERPLKNMIKAAKKDGVTLFIMNSYRSIEEQEAIYQQFKKDFIAQGDTPEEAEEKTKSRVMIPGYSEHHTGLAIDFKIANNDNLNEKMWKWLAENGDVYGFILRYPEEKQKVTEVIYEPWHYRYVGKKIAKEIKERKVCLEEYKG